MGARPIDDKASDTLVVVSGEGFWTGSSTLPHLHHTPTMARVTDIDEAVAAYVARLPWPSRRRDAVALVDLMRRATGQEPRVYDRTIGYGMYHYRYPRARGDYAGVYTKRAREGGSGS